VLSQCDIEAAGEVWVCTSCGQQGGHDAVGGGEAAGVDHQHLALGVEPQQRVGPLAEGARQQVQQDFFLEFLLHLGRHAFVAGLGLVALHALLDRRLHRRCGHRALLGAEFQDQVAADDFGQHLALVAARRHPAAGFRLGGAAGHEAGFLQDTLEGLELGQDEIVRDAEETGALEHGYGDPPRLRTGGQSQGF
jgi:hypothetical protein